MAEPERGLPNEKSNSEVSSLTNVAVSKAKISSSEKLFKVFRGGALPTHYKTQHHIGVRSATERVVTYCEKFFKVKQAFNCFTAKTDKIKKKTILEDEEPISNKFEYVDSDILFNKVSNMKPWDSKNGYNVSGDVESNNSRKDCCSKVSRNKAISNTTKQKISTKKANFSKNVVVSKTSKEYSEVQIDKNKSSLVDVKKVKRPRAISPLLQHPPRLRRLASLNAEAKVNIFFEKEEPKSYKRIKIEGPTKTTKDKPKQDSIETTASLSIENEKNIPVIQSHLESEILASDSTTESETDVTSASPIYKKKIYKHRLTDKGKPVKEHRRRRVRDWFAPRSKKPQKKLLEKSKLTKDNVPKAKKKPKQQAENNRKIIVEILPEEPRSSRRLASLNAQAIIAVANIPDRVTSPRSSRIIKKILPKFQKKLKEDKKIYDEVIVVDDSPKKRECDPDIYEFVDEIEKPYDSTPSSRLCDIKEKHHKKILGQSFTPYTPSPSQTHLASSPHLMGSIPYTGHTTHIPTLYPYHNGAIIPSAHCQTLTLSGMGSISSLPLGLRHYGSAFSVPHYNHASHLSYVHECEAQGTCPKCPGVNMPLITGFYQPAGPLIQTIGDACLLPKPIPYQVLQPQPHHPHSVSMTHSPIPQEVKPIHRPEIKRLPSPDVEIIPDPEIKILDPPEIKVHPPLRVRHAEIKVLHQTHYNPRIEPKISHKTETKINPSETEFWNTQKPEIVIIPEKSLEAQHHAEVKLRSDSISTLGVQSESFPKNECHQKLELIHQSEIKSNHKSEHIMHHSKSEEKNYSKETKNSHKSDNIASCKTDCKSNPSPECKEKQDSKCEMGSSRNNSKDRKHNSKSDSKAEDGSNKTDSKNSHKSDHKHNGKSDSKTENNGSNKKDKSGSKSSSKTKLDKLRSTPSIERLPRLRRATNGWCWEGEPEFKLVYGRNDSPAVMRRCYPAMRHKEGDIIRRKDCVLLLSGSRKKDLPFVAKIVALWENTEDGEMMMTILWYYRPEHTEVGRRYYHAPDELFASKHRDENSVACIDDKCYVLTFAEYCRYRARIKMLSQGMRPIPPLVPDSEDPYPRKDILPPDTVNQELVLFCRQVYDFRQKRVLKNPS